MVLGTRPASTSLCACLNAGVGALPCWSSRRWARTATSAASADCPVAVSARDRATLIEQEYGQDAQATPAGHLQRRPVHLDLQAPEQTDVQPPPARSLAYQ